MEALRSIAGTARRRPAKLAYFVASLGVSFGFIAAVVTLAHASWFRMPVGVADQSYVTALRLVGGSYQSMSIRDFDEIVARVPEISWFYAMPAFWLNLQAGSPDASEPLQPQLVSPGFFEQLGVRPAFGTLLPEDSATAAVITDDVWRRVYGRQDVVGEMLGTQDGTSMPVIGVAPPGFEGPMRHQPDVWVMNLPLVQSAPSMAPHLGVEAKRRTASLWPNVTVFGVLPAGPDRDIGFAAARERLAEHRFDAAMIVIDEGEPDPETGEVTGRQAFSFGFNDTDRVALGQGLETSPEKRADVVQKTLWLAGVVIMLLLMSFVAVVEFLLAEHVSREDEQNVRIAVGAAPMDLFGRALAENLALALVMAVIGWLASGYVLDVLLRVEPFASYLGQVRPAARVAGLGIAGVLLTLAFVICLGYVSWFVSRSAAALARSGRWLRRAARQLLLLVCVASFMAVLSLAGRYLGDARLSLGFANTEVANVELRDPNRDMWALGRGQQLEGMLEAIDAIPGVRSTAAATLEPLAHDGFLHNMSIRVVGTPEQSDSTFFQNFVTRSFFRTIGVELLAGRLFEGDSNNEVVLSRSAAEALGGVDAVLGTPLATLADMGGEWERTIVGVVEEVPYGDYAAGSRAVIYGPSTSIGTPHRWLIDAEPGLDLAEALTQLPQYEGWEFERRATPAQRFREQFLAKRSVEVVLAVAAGFALVLALSGVGNSLARNIAETRSRIGIRLALGATPGELALAQSGTSVRELIVAAAVVGGVGIAAKVWAPAFTEALELWWLLPAFACLALLCTLLIRFLMGQLARRHAISALVDGSVADARQGGA